MKLYYTTTSPYARKVRILVMKAGLEDQITLVETTVRDPASSLLPLSPPGKVPVLETPEGVILSETNYICAYLAEKFEEVQLFSTGGNQWTVLALEGLACGLLEGTVTWVRAMRAPEPIRNPKAIALEKGRVDRCLDAFEKLAGDWSEADAPFQLPHITLGCALGALSFRLPQVDWRQTRPNLTAWWNIVSRKALMIETAPYE